MILKDALFLQVVLRSSSTHPSLILRLTIYLVPRASEWGFIAAYFD